MQQRRRFKQTQSRRLFSDWALKSASREEGAMRVPQAHDTTVRSGNASQYSALELRSMTPVQGCSSARHVNVIIP